MYIIGIFQQYDIHKSISKLYIADISMNPVFLLNMYYQHFKFPPARRPRLEHFESDWQLLTNL